MVYCPNCGIEIKDDLTKCPSCGYNMLEEQHINYNGIYTKEDNTISKKSNNKKHLFIILFVGFILIFMFFGYLSFSNFIISINETRKNTDEIVRDKYNRVLKKAEYYVFYAHKSKKVTYDKLINEDKFTETHRNAPKFIYGDIRCI